MRYFYDCEFIEDGRTIDLVSIGIVNSARDTYYAISSEFDHRAFLKNRWLVENVLPSLPFFRTSQFAECLMLDIDHPDGKLVKPRWQIGEEVREFLLGGDGEHVELWAYYGAYDHVALCQLWGPMIKLPEGLPMWTHDIMQLRERSVNALPEQESGHHNALADARHVAAMYAALTGGAS